MSVDLIDRLKTAGLDQFIPADLRTTSSGDYYDPDMDIRPELDGIDDIDGFDINGYGMSQKDRLRAEYDSYSKEEEHCLDIVKAAAYKNQDEEEEIEGKYAPEHEEEESRPETLYDLKELFHLEYLSDEEFLRLKISDLFRVTDNELSFIDPELLQMMSLDRYIVLMQDKNIIRKFPSPEKRIRYCQMEAVTDTRGLSHKLYLYHTSDSNDFYQYVVDNGDKDFIDENRRLCREQALPDSEVSRFTEKLILNQKPERAFYLLDLYADYLMMYPYVMYYNRKLCEAGGENFTKYTLYPKVSHLKDLHDKAIRDYDGIMSKVQSRDHDHTNELISMQINTPEYKRFLYEADGYIVKAPQCLEDLQNEGRILNHCVASYITPVAAGQTKIYFIRYADRPDEPFYTAEIKTDDTGRWCLMQCYTRNDTTLKSRETRDFIKKWCRNRQISIRCRI